MGGAATLTPDVYVRKSMARSATIALFAGLVALATLVFIAFAAQEERVDRVRFSPAFPSRAIEAGLAYIGASPSEIDVTPSSSPTAS